MAMREEAAFRSTALPGNPRPFVRRLGEILEEGEPITGTRARSVLWVLVAQCHGLGVVDLSEEWRRLDAAWEAMGGAGALMATTDQPDDWRGTSR